MPENNSKENPIEEPQIPESMAEKEISPPHMESQKALKELAEYKEKYLRIYAEFDNARKRFDRDRIEFVKYANEQLLVDFLAIVDDLDRSVEAAHAKHEDYSAFLKGIEMVMVRIHDLLKRYSVQPLEAVGKKFDPHAHEILMQVPSPEHAEGTVLEEFQRGYCLGEKVIRTAKVKVAVPPIENPANDEQKEKG
jgi:molecular chaperone GrpE